MKHLLAASLGSLASLLAGLFLFLALLYLGVGPFGVWLAALQDWQQDPTVEGFLAEFTIPGSEGYRGMVGVSQLVAYGLLPLTAAIAVLFTAGLAQRLRLERGAWCLVAALIPLAVAFVLPAALPEGRFPGVAAILLAAGLANHFSARRPRQQSG